MHELTAIMRQKDDQHFAALLNRLREGKHTDSDIAQLRQCLVQVDNPRLPASAPHLFPTNRLVNSHNQQLFDAATTEKVIIKALDVVQGNQ